MTASLHHQIAELRKAEQAIAPMQMSAMRRALSSSPAPDLVAVPKTTLQWIAHKTRDPRNPAVCFVVTKLLAGEDFSPLRDDALLHLPGDMK